MGVGIPLALYLVTRNIIELFSVVEPSADVLMLSASMSLLILFAAVFFALCYALLLGIPVLWALLLLKLRSPILLAVVGGTMSWLLVGGNYLLPESVVVVCGVCAGLSVGYGLKLEITVA